LARASTYTGADAALKDLSDLQVFAPDRFAKALYQEAQIELKEIIKETPVDTGALRATLVLEGPFREGRRIWVVVSAGGPSVTYAFIVHEDTEAFHKVGGAKYIERPLRESAPFLAERIAKRIDLNRAA